MFSSLCRCVSFMQHKGVYAKSIRVISLRAYCTLLDTKKQDVVLRFIKSIWFFNIDLEVCNILSQGSYTVLRSVARRDCDE